MLEQSDIAHYLLSLGVVKPQAVIDEDFRVVDASRRNAVFLATTSTGPTYVVKQAPAGDGSSLAHEATVLRLLAGVPALAPHVPEVVVLDGSCLVLRTPGQGRDWSDHRGRFPLVPARVLGRLLARLHGLTVALPEARDPVFALRLPEPSYDLVLELSAGARDLLARIQRSDFLCNRLEEVGGSLRGGALVHGDLRWDNCLALPAPGGTRRTRVLVLDWELAGPCDPAFDVGSVLSEYLRVWVGSVPIVEPVDPGRLVAHAHHPLAAMRPAMQAFWSAYKHPGAPALRHVVELCAVRLLQTAVERAQGVDAPAAHVITLVQLADNMLRRPEEAVFSLLGLRP
ncbi:MAG TPA: phosphotransferase [Solirubrobacteraceae bacterium]|nr:phosphotransferase [Solirubrobacteraceae bacterium]